VESLVADAFGTNCFVVATRPGEQCVVIDPGFGIAARLDDLLDRYRLRPAAVVLTHGHLDHTFSVVPVCGAHDVPAYLHPDDREQLADPGKGLSPEMSAMFRGLLTFSEPDRVEPLVDGRTVSLAGVDFTVDHAPGHTRGSVLLRTPTAEAPLCFTGDVVFAGSIGRTDLPGGDPDAMVTSLRTKVLSLPDETVLHPGHGPSTTMARERAQNPYLREAGLASVNRRLL